VAGGGYKERVSKGKYVEVLCIHVWKWKMRPVETIPGIGEVGKKDGGSEFQPWYIVRTFINVTMYPQYNKSMII
jgi:hypothetical protein